MSRAAVIARLMVIVGTLHLAGLAAYRGATRGQWEVVWLVFNIFVAAVFTYQLVTRGRRARQ
jgi:hypothetical protein